MDPVVIGFGLGVGVLVGMTGIGGGSIMTPLLILVLGTKPVVAIGTDLAYAAITKTVGGWRHFRQGTVDTSISLWLAVGSVPGALGGVVVLERIHASYGDDFDSVVLMIVAAALLLTGAATLGRSVFAVDPASRERETVRLGRRHKAAAIVIGVSVGFVLGMSSAGSGALIALGLIVVFRLTPRRVVGTDIFHAAILLWVAALAHLLSGNVDLPLTLNLLVGSVPGVWFGSHLSVTVSQTVLRSALGVVLCAAGLGLLTKAGVGVPAAVLVAVPVLLAASAIVIVRRRSRATVKPPPLGAFPPSEPAAARRA